MRFIEYSIPLLISIALASGCKQTEEPPTPSTPAQSTPKKSEDIKPDESSSLKGADTNANGIRDDIEAFLHKQYSNPEQRSAAMQYARSYQAVFSVDDQEDARKVRALNSRATACISKHFDKMTKELNASTVTNQIISMTFNTKSREKSHEKYNKMLIGTVWSLPKGNACDHHNIASTI